MVSILTVTLNRRELAEACLGKALRQAGEPYEFLSVDNGSTDGVADYIATLQPVFHRRNESNEGYAAMVNQMILRAKGEYICVVDPDIVLPNDWLWKLVRVNELIPESGLSSYHCVQLLYPERIVNGCSIHPGGHVYGIKFLKREVIEKLGYFAEFGIYGQEDVDYNDRLNKAGYLNYYIGDGMRAEHAGEDGLATTEYRRQKWDALAQSHIKYAEHAEYMERTGDYYVPPPPLACHWEAEALDLSREPVST